MRVAFDIGGVISKFPRICRQMIVALTRGGAEVFILTDIHDRVSVLDVLRRNEICPPVPEANVFTSDYAVYGEACKAVLVDRLAIDVLIDDHGGYVAWPWAQPAPMRLLVQPDQRRPYHAPEWETDGSEGDFGRHAYCLGADDLT
jgi:hypothetical protein